MDIQIRKIKIIKIAALIAIVGNLILAIIKICTGVMGNSEALLADGFDSLADVFISIITLILVKVISRPANIKYPWGHGRAEAVATAFLSFILFSVGVQLIISAGSDFIKGGQEVVPSFFTVSVTWFSILGKLLLALSQHILGEKANSAVLKANAKNMLSDVLISVGVLVGLIISVYTGSVKADIIIAMLIGIFIIKTAVGIFIEANLELMDGTKDLEPYRSVVEAVNAVAGASNPHRARMRLIAGFWDIDLDIDVDPNCTVLEAHRIASEVESEIKKRLNVFDIVIHVEPRGDNGIEIFGLSEKDIQGK